MADFLSLLLNCLLILVAGVSLVMWVRLLPAIFKHGVREFADTWLPVTRRECPSWGLSELFIMFGSMIVSGQLLLLFASENGWYKIPARGGSIGDQSPETLFVVLAISGLANCIAIGVILLWMWNIDRDNLRNLGLSIDRSMIGLGFKAALMTLPPVLAIAALANLMVAEYEHEVLDVLQQLHSPRVFAVLFLGTAVVTPIAEEIIFRGLVQGGLQRLADRVAGYETTAPDGGASQKQANSSTRSLTDEQASDQQGENPADAQSGDWEPVAYWPVIASSLIFALMHLGQGAAPIPLFVLSVGLGYLYRQTGSLIPCIVLHMILNSITLVATLLQ